MVNSGKPSKACHRCRERRIKCDLNKSGCSQCARSRTTCPGYRNNLDLMFKNESDDIAKKIEDREAAKKNSLSPNLSGDVHKSNHKLPSPRRSSVSLKSSASRPSPDLNGPSRTSSAPARKGSKESSVSSSSSSSNDDRKSSVSIPESVGIGLDWPIPIIDPFFMLPSPAENQAMAFFFSHYILQNVSKTRGHYEYLPAMYHSNKVDEHLSTSVLSVAYAGLANATQSQYLLKEAFREYGQALKITNKRLQCHKSSKNDSTVIAIMLLGMFETLTYRNERSRASWAEHINGATKLITLRGKEQFSTRLGLRVFVQLMGNIMSNCMQNLIPFPQEIIELRKVSEAFFNPDAPGWRLSHVMIEFVNFCVRVKETSDYTADDIINDALAVDNEMLRLSQTMPKQWQYETYYTTNADPKLVFEGRYDVYVDYWVAQMWNSLRIIRILLHECIRGQLLKGFAATPPAWTDVEWVVQLQISTDTLNRLAMEICASVPQHEGIIPVLNPQGARQSQVDPSDFPPLGPADVAKDYRASPNVGCRSKASTSVYSAATVDAAVFDTSLPSHHDPPFPQRPEPSLPTPPTFSADAAGMLYLIWPLKTVGRMTVCPPHMRTWVIHRLRFIARELGVQQAKHFADDLEKAKGQAPPESLHAMAQDARVGIGFGLPLRQAQAFPAHTSPTPKSPLWIDVAENYRDTVMPMMATESPSAMTIPSLTISEHDPVAGFITSGLGGEGVEWQFDAAMEEQGLGLMSTDPPWSGLQVTPPTPEAVEAWLGV